MSRYFLGLAILSLLLMLANLGIGLFGGDYNGQFTEIEKESQPVRRRLVELRAELRPNTAEIEKESAKLAEIFGRFTPTRDWTMVHVLLGVTTGLVVLLVNCLAVTYFIGTARWCREVVETYSFDEKYITRSDAIKGAALPYAIVGIVATILLAGLGAASYRGASILSNAETFVLPHHIAAWLTIAALAWSYHIQAEKISENSALIEEITDEVQRVRKERGLPTKEDDEEEEEEKEVEAA